MMETNNFERDLNPKEAMDIGRNRRIEGRIYKGGLTTKMGISLSWF